MDLARRLTELEHEWTKARYVRKRDDGSLRPAVVQAFRGWVGRDGVAHVAARVVETPRFAAATDRQSWLGALGGNVARFTVLELYGVPVDVTIGGATASGVTDEEGYVLVDVQTEGLAPGWQPVEFVAHAPQGDATGIGRALVVEADPAFAVVSDLDDTVLVTGMTEGVNAVVRTMFRDAHSRRAVPGMASLYRALVRGPAPEPGSGEGLGSGIHPPFFYVSSGAWNLHDNLAQFLQMRGFPRGPLFLTDWGPTRERLMRSGYDHKIDTLRRLFTAFPDLRFVLIGDSGEKDPVIYADIAAEAPDRILAVLLVDVPGREHETRSATVAQLRDSVQKLGVPYHLCGSAADAARYAHELGLVDSVALEEVDTELGSQY